MVETINLDSAEAVNQEDLEELQRHRLNLGHALTAAEHLNEFTKDIKDDVCEFWGDNPFCIGASLAIACFPNPPRIICDTVTMLFKLLAYPIFVGVTIAYQAVDDIFEIATLGELYCLVFHTYAIMNFLCNNELLSNLMLSFVIFKVLIRPSTASTTPGQRTSTHLNTIKKIGKH